MFGGHLLLAMIFIKTASVVIAFALSACVIMKIRNLRMKKKKAAYLKKHQPYFVYIQSHLGEPEKLRVPQGRLRRLELEVIRDQLTEWIERLKGGERDKLIALCEDLGLVETHLKRLRSRIEWKKIEAAYHLGMMRSKRAAPFLLEQMETHPPGPSLYILARSVAKCARDEHDLSQMIHILVRHRNPAHRLTADILKDSGLDLTTLAGRLLQERDANVIRIALICLQGQACFHLLPALKRWLDAEEKALRIETAKVILSVITATQVDWLNRLLKHQDWEIRVLAAKAIGSWGAAGQSCLPLEGLTDGSWPLRYSSANSLASLGEEGMQENAREAKVI